MKQNHQKRDVPEISAGSMADVAFLLLIFFLVVTTIDVDKGLLVNLPPWCEGPDCVVKAPDDGVYSVLVNMDDQLLVESEAADIKTLRQSTKDFLREQNSKKPRSAVVSLVNDRGTSYEAYLAVYNELKAAYNEVWEEEALAHYGTSYSRLGGANKKEIRTRYPLVISEAEPTNFGK